MALTAREKYKIKPGTITVRTHGPMGCRERSFEWSGGRVALVSSSLWKLFKGIPCGMLPWKILVHGYDQDRDGYYVENIGSNDDAVWGLDDVPYHLND